MLPKSRPSSNAAYKTTFGLVPATESEHVRGDIADFCRLLGAAISADVLPHRAPTPEALASAIGAGRIQIAWVSPTLLASSAFLANVVPLASSVRQGVAFYHAALFTLSSSRFRSLKDLHRARVAWVSQSSAAGYLFPRLALLKKSIDPALAFASEAFLGSHGAVVSAVAEGRVDVGATFAVFENGNPAKALLRAGFDEGKINHAMHLLDISGPVPADVFIALPNVPQTLRSRLVPALEQLASNDTTKGILLRLFGADGFAPCSQETLDSLRDFVTMARGQRLLQG